MTQMQEVTPLHQALTETQTLGGVEREAAVIITLFSIYIFIAGKDFISILLAILFWAVGMGIFRKISQKDKQATKIFLRHLKYKEFYPAQEHTKR